MSTQNVYQEWRAKTLQEGIQQGIQQGLHLGQQQTLLQLLRHKFGAVPPEVAARVEDADAAQLNQWTLRVLDASDLSGVFAA